MQWNKRWFYGYYVTRNLALDPAADWNAYNITAPADSRLPGGGGYTVTRPARRRADEVRPVELSRSRRRATTATSIRYLERRRRDGGDARDARASRSRAARAPGRRCRTSAACRTAVPDALLAPQAAGHRRATSRASRALNGHARPAWRPDSTATSRPGSSRSSGASARIRCRRSTWKSRRRSRASPARSSPPTTTCRRRRSRSSSGRAPSGGVANVTVNLVTPGYALRRPRQRARSALLEDPAASAARARRSRLTCTTRSMRTRC